MNPLESQLAYPFGETLPEPGATIEVAPGVHWLRMGLPFAARPHQPLAAARRESRRTAVGARAGRIVDCGIDDAATRAAWEQHLRDRARRPAGAARDRHPHASRPHRLRPLAVRALERARCGSAPPTSTSPGSPAAPAPASAGRSRPPSWRSTAWPPIPTPSTRSARAPTTTAAWCRRVPAQLPAPARTAAGSRSAAARAQPLDLPRRLRPRARAHGAALRERAAC